MVKAGGDSWYFLTADYAFGHALERDVSEVVKASGGKVLGAVRHPLSTQDFSSFLLQAQSSKAKVIGLANAGQDTINSIKQAGEFGIVKGGQKLAGLLVFATDVQSLTLPVAQGLVLTESFYWDLNDETRAWTKRYRAKKDRLPSMLTAGVYSEDQGEVSQFLDRVQAGVLYVNRRAGATTGAWPGIQAFGGWKGSGSTGKNIGGHYTLPCYLREQSRTVCE